METKSESGLALQVAQLRLLQKISRIWSMKNEPDIPCFEIERNLDGTYSLYFLNDNEDVISEPYLILVGANLDILLPECSCVISYDPEAGELSSGDKVYIPFKSIPETAGEWREHLAGRLEEPDDAEQKKSLEYNRRVILSWLCCEWMPEHKDDVPNILISRSIPSEYEMRFLREGKSVLPEAFLIEQDYEMFYFRLEDNCIDISYFPAVDQILVGGTYYTRVAMERQEI